MQRSWSLAVFGLLSVTGCGLFFRAPAPMPTISYADVNQASPRDLLVLLPGRGDGAATFAAEGIVELARRNAPTCDIVAADATTGYYIHRNLTQRLNADVFEPARARGYRAAVISGISMGGLGALLFAQFNPKVVTDVLVVAPFLGDEDVIQEIERAGGVARWMPPASTDVDATDYQRALWRWLKGCAERRESCPRILLGFGSEDKFARAHRLLAAVLPPEQVVVVPGGHTWEPWRRLYAALLPKVAPR
jgi:pimeloyl-ACP methyl ester carboxylesterase